MKNNFSKEYLFELSLIKSHAVEVIFFPNSEGFKKYGSRIVIETIYEDIELELMRNNYNSNPPINTFGLVRAKVLDNDSLAEHQRNDLMNTGFNTNDIFEIRHLE